MKSLLIVLGAILGCNAWAANPSFSDYASEWSSGVTPTNAVVSSFERSPENRMSPWRLNIMGMEPFFWKGSSMTETDYWGRFQVMGTNGLTSLGWNEVDLTDGWGLGTNANSAGYWSGYSTNFPSGIPFTISVAHTNGVKVYIYQQPEATSSSGMPGLVPRGTNYIWQFASNVVSWGADGVRLDFQHTWNTDSNDFMAYYCGQMGAALEYYAGRPLPIYTAGWQSGFHTMRDAGSVNVWQLNSVTGDLGSAHPLDATYYWVDLLSHWDAQKIYMGQSGPGHYYSLDYCPITLGNSYPVFYAAVGSAMSANILYSYAESASAFAIETNQWLVDIVQDPLGMPGHEVLSNATGRVISRKLSRGRFFVALVNNSTNSSNTVGCNASDIGLSPAGLFTAFDIFNGTNTPQGSTLTSAIPAMTAVGFLVSPVDAFLPSPNRFLLTNNFEIVRAGDVTLNGGARISVSSYTSGDNYYFTDGISFAGNASGEIDVTLPMWVTNVTLGMIWSEGSSTPTAWTNSYNALSQPWTGRVSNGTSNQVIYIQGTWTNATQSLAYPAALVPKVLGIVIPTATNTANRYLISPIYLTYQ